MTVQQLAPMQPFYPVSVLVRVHWLQLVQSSPVMSLHTCWQSVLLQKLPICHKRWSGMGTKNNICVLFHFLFFSCSCQESNYYHGYFLGHVDNTVIPVSYTHLSCRRIERCRSRW